MLNPRQRNFGVPSKCKICSDTEYCNPILHNSSGNVKVSTYTDNFTDLLRNGNEFYWPDYIIQSPVFSQNFLNYIDSFPNELSYQNILNILNFLSDNSRYDSSDIDWLKKIYNMSNLSLPLGELSEFRFDNFEASSPHPLLRSRSQTITKDNTKLVCSVGIIIRVESKKWQWFKVVLANKVSYSKSTKKVNKGKGVLPPPFWVTNKYLKWADPYWLEQSETAPIVVLSIVASAASVVVLGVALTTGSITAAGGYFTVSLSAVTLISNIDDITTDEQGLTFLTRTFSSYREEIETAKFCIAIIGFGRGAYKAFRVPKLNTKPIVKIAGLLTLPKSSSSVIKNTKKLYDTLSEEVKEKFEQVRSRQILEVIISKEKLALTKEQKESIIKEMSANKGQALYTLTFDD